MLIQNVVDVEMAEQVVVALIIVLFQNVLRNITSIFVMNDEFPCDKVNKKVFTETIIQKWLKRNKKIREIGINNYYNDYKEVPHYVNYKKILFDHHI